MYALAPHRSDTNIGYQYGSLNVDITASIRKARGWINQTVTSEKEQALPLFENHVSSKMLKAQESALKKVWGGAENDVWDDLYKELNASM